MKVFSTILQILGFVLLSGAVTILTFVQPGAFRGFEGTINKFLAYVGLDGSISGVKKREKLVYWLIGLAVLLGSVGLIVECSIE